MKKHYFITYQATDRDGDKFIWNEVANISPMAFIKEAENAEEDGGGVYHDFVIINTCEISKEDYDKFKDRF